MHSSTARGFYAMLLSKDEREKLRDLEKSLPQGRYFVNREIALAFNIQIEKEKRGKTPEEISAMDELWRQFNREIWKAKKLMKLRTNKMGLPIPTSTPQDPTPKEIGAQMDDDEAAFGNWVGMDADERFNWGEYVVAHYRRPRTSGTALDEAFGMAG